MKVKIYINKNYNSSHFRQILKKIFNYTSDSVLEREGYRQQKQSFYNAEDPAQLIEPNTDRGLISSQAKENAQQCQNDPPPQNKD